MSGPSGQSLQQHTVNTVNTVHTVHTVQQPELQQTRGHQQEQQDGRKRWTRRDGTGTAATWIPAGRTRHQRQEDTVCEVCIVLLFNCFIFLLCGCPLNVNFAGRKIIDKWWLLKKTKFYLQIEAIAKPKKSPGYGAIHLLRELQ